MKSLHNSMPKAPISRSRPPLAVGFFCCSRFAAPLSKAPSVSVAARWMYGKLEILQHECLGLPLHDAQVCHAQVLRSHLQGDPVLESGPHDELPPFKAL